ncbi:hypothetical protein [Sinorhizobium fredii]|uniref:hypothetical protein n=1 Tax=Rhizobium fredii TaxID=380 RepID=UPI0004AF7F31|nr:hypothetical protein [Sinorhizobium fredii]
MLTISMKDFRFDDARLADRLEAQVKELRSRIPYESSKERRHLQDEIAAIEAVLCRMHC